MGYDTQEGLDFLSHELYRQRRDDVAYSDLHHWLSVRRGTRGQVGPLEPRDQLLFAEMICDAARARLDKPGERLPSLGGKHSAVWFSERFAQAFPGVRGVHWFDDAGQIKTRLLKLLEPPLTYVDAQPAGGFAGQAIYTSGASNTFASGSIPSGPRGEWIVAVLFRGLRTRRAAPAWQILETEPHEPCAVTANRCFRLPFIGRSTCSPALAWLWTLGRPSSAPRSVSRRISGDTSAPRRVVPL